MMKMDRGCVLGFLFPKVGNCARQQPQHPAYPLKITKGRRLSCQGCQNVRVQRITRSKRLGCLGADSMVAKRLSVSSPAVPVGIDDCRNSRFIYGLEQAATEHLNCFIFLSGVQERRFPRGNTLRFRHVVGDKLVLFVEGVGRPPVFANRQRIDENRVGNAFDRLKQRTKERGQLKASVFYIAYLAQVN